MYDAGTMPLRTTSTIASLGALALLLAPLGARSAEAAPASPPAITLTATRATGAEAVTIAGTAPAGQPLEAALYARYSQDLPTVLLTRRAVPVGADGRFSSTLTTAPAFFRNAIVTVVIQSLPAGPSARASITVGAPNLAAPPDDIPASVR